MSGSQMPDLLSSLSASGACIPLPETVYLDPRIPAERISPQGVTIHPGCRISGAETFIAEGAVIGAEGPVTMHNCQIGPGVHLKSGYFKEAVFLEGASMGLGAHVREGTILEEAASGAHTVGLKQTILFPFATLGSLINFCDVLMAGGTGRKHHSEVGSSYIHFNFTPNQDKATPSLLGDVPNGVMLDQPPIFLGGQGGLVGPCRLAYGTVIAAGTICRKDELRPGHLIFGGALQGGSIPWSPGPASGIGRIVGHNVYFMANLVALYQWYRHVRGLFVSPRFPRALQDGLLHKVRLALGERAKRLEDFDRGLDAPHFGKGWGRVEAIFSAPERDRGPSQDRDLFLEVVSQAVARQGPDYIGVIKGLGGGDRDIGRRWLQGIVQEIVGKLAPP